MSTTTIILFLLRIWIIEFVLFMYYAVFFNI